MADDHVAPGSDHLQRVFRVIDIRHGQHVLGAGAAHHLDFATEAEAGGLEIEPVLSVDAATVGKLMTPENPTRRISSNTIPMSRVGSTPYTPPITGHLASPGLPLFRRVSSMISLALPTGRLPSILGWP